MARGRSADYDLNRETIVRAATRLFAQQGYPGTSMSDLAKACGVSKPLLYHYVSDKYELLREITEGHVTRLEAIIGEVEALELDAQARLRELIRRFVHEYAQARHDHGVLTQDVKFLEPRDRSRVRRKERAVVAAFAATIAEARPELARAALAKPLTMLLFGMINWMFTWLKPAGALSHDDMAPIVADLFLGGLGAVRPPPPVLVEARGLNRRPISR
ncbi:MAG: TetR family transcriptional regulator [Proteobacteria bacterium]|nr:TetR family transcriptional regulator [Pseudomonadota bacterium]